MIRGKHQAEPPTEHWKYRRTCSRADGAMLKSVVLEVSSYLLRNSNCDGSQSKVSFAASKASSTMLGNSGTPGVDD